MSAISTQKKQRRKRCSECGELKDADDVQGKQRLCESCEQDLVYCQICDEYKDRCFDAGCRHVQWAERLGCNCGCGATEIEADDHKESFIELLKRFAPLKDDEGDLLVPRLLKQIAANNCWTFWHGPMIGDPPDLDLRFKVPGRKDGWCTYFCTISVSTQLAWGDEAIKAMQLGMAWLCSLDHKTGKPNQLTAEWIREYLAAESVTQPLGTP